MSITTGRGSSRRPSAPDNFQRQIDRIEHRLAEVVESGRRDRRALWSVLVPLEFGIAFTIAGEATWWISLYSRFATAIGIGLSLLAAFNARRMVRVDRARRAMEEAGLNEHTEIRSLEEPMTDILKDVGRHIGSWGNGHYEAKVEDGGSVIIATILDNANQAYTVSLDPSEWDRLVAWVEWQRKRNIPNSSGNQPQGNAAT